MLKNGRRQDNWGSVGSVLVLAVLITACLAVAGLGALITAPQTASGGWYYTLEKPFFTPPGSLFGLVWTVLYLSIALSGWLVWRKQGFLKARVPMTLFFVQLALNLLWSVAFFKLESPALGLIEILVLWTSIFLTILAFLTISRLAGWLLVPYLAWVTFATVLNAGIWWLNT